MGEIKTFIFYFKEAKTRVAREKPPGQGMISNNKLNAHIEA